MEKQFKVTNGPKAHIGKVINIADNYVPSTGYNVHGKYTRYDGIQPIEFTKENGYAKDYYFTITVHAIGVTVIVLTPCHRGKRITLELEAL